MHSTLHFSTAALLILARSPSITVSHNMAASDNVADVSVCV